MLNDAETASLDLLWDELRYVSQEALQIVTALEQILEFATQDADPRKYDPVLQPIAENAKAFKELLVHSEAVHLKALMDFASRAYRRPLEDRERQGLSTLYHQLRAKEMPHDEALRFTLARLLTSPNFLYKIERPGPGAEPRPVSDLELATRLSYFLWSSTPDAELRRAAAAHELRDPDTLMAQARRMLHDPRVRRLAIEFACQWLHIRDFDQVEEKSPRHFPEFADLRASFYEESIRFFTDLFQNDGAVTSILDADHTFVDDRLSAFYGFSESSHEGWRRVDGLRQYGRGGVLTMASTLAKQSGASRTSPILRGHWISETLLGEKLPKPPKDVPQLPDEAPVGLTERQLIEQHSSAAACAKCHVRFDPYGFALENFDAIGRYRQRGGDGQAIDTRTQLADGTRLNCAPDLRDYLLNDRHDAFIRQFCRNLLGYALGRATQLSDEPLLDEMASYLKKNQYRFGAAIESVVHSRQFRNIRGRATPLATDLSPQNPHSSPDPL